MKYDKSNPKYPCRTYDSLPHPEVYFDNNCTKCVLGNEYAVGGAGPDDLTKVKLIVISDHAGAYEAKEHYPQVPNSLVQFKRQTLIPRPRNSGQLLRDTIEELFDLCTWSEVWITNAIRCDPNHKGNNVNITERLLKVCANSWLREEIDLLSKHAPTAPILIAGSKALVSMQQLYKSDFPQERLDKLLRRNSYRFREHPLAFTLNPAIYAKSEPKLETRMGIHRGKLVVSGIQSLATLMPSPIQDFQKDFNWLNKYIPHF